MNTIKKLNYLMDRKMKMQILCISVLIIVGSIAELLGVAVIAPIVNLAMDENFAQNKWCKIVIDLTGYEKREEVLLVMIVAVIVIYVAKNAYLSWMYSRLYRFSATVKKQMAVKLMESYLNQPYSFFLKKNTSDLIRSVNQDTAQLYEVVLNCLLVAANAFTAFVLVIALVITNPVMTLVIVAVLALCACIIIFCVQKRTRLYGRKNQELSGYLIKYLQQTFEGIKEIKILNNESHFIKEYGDTYQEQTDYVKKYSLVNLIPKYLIEAVAIVGIMVYLGVNILYNPNYMDLIPQLATFVAAAYKLLPSVNAIYAYINTIIYHRASIDLVYQDVKEASNLELKEFDTAKGEKIEFKEKIELSDVTFHYEGTEKKVLENVSIEIPKGKSVALIGPSGGGKTTTADLALGLMRPVAGEVRVDGKDIRENLAGWRNNIGYIPQSIYLTDGSIKSNVALGLQEEKIDTERVWQVLREAQLADFVKELEKGLDTEIGERGVRMSGGQRQRLGIARALYRNPDVLVFDEATSALDNETEKEVMKAIDSLHGNKTMIMIAHRLSTIENCDIVYKVENAKIVRER